MDQCRGADGNGIPDWWEQQYFCSITTCAPDADPDGAGMPNLLEYLADTNPTNAFSVLRFFLIIPEANRLRIKWQGGAQARQFLVRHNDLSLSTNPWVII